MIAADQSFANFRESLRSDPDLVQLLPFIDMYLVRFPKREQAIVLFDELCRRWANARGLELKEVAA